MSQHRKHRGYKTERVVAEYFSQWWPGATVGRGAGNDIVNIPMDVEIKSRSEFRPLEWLRQSAKRANGKMLSLVVSRCNGQGEDNPGDYLAFMRLADLVQLLIMAGYADIKTGTDKLIPERCAQCGSWKLEEVPCRTCQKVSNANL